MTLRRDRVFWIEIVVGVAPAVLLIAPRLLRWSLLFAYGLRARALQMLVANGQVEASGLAGSAYFLAWSLTALIAVAGLAVAVLARPERLRRHPVLRGLLAMAMLGGLTALVQFLIRPLGGLSPRRPLVLLVLAGPAATSVHHLLRSLRPTSGDRSTSPPESQPTAGADAAAR